MCSIVTFCKIHVISQGTYHFVFTVDGAVSEPPASVHYPAEVNGAATAVHELEFTDDDGHLIVGTVSGTVHRFVKGSWVDLGQFFFGAFAFF